MEISKFRALIPIEEYLVDHTINVGDLICIDAIINLQNITNSMTIAIPRMKKMSVIDVNEGLVSLSTYPVNRDVRSVTKLVTSGMFAVYISKVCCLVSDIPTTTVSQLNLFNNEEPISHQ